MISKVVRHEKDFSIVDNAPWRDSRLSLKAKGLLIYLLTKKENWEVRMGDLLNRHKNKKAAIWSALRELRDAGYAKNETVRSKDGTRLAGRKWVIYELAQEVKTKEKSKNHQSHRKSVSLKSNAAENRPLSKDRVINNKLSGGNRSATDSIGFHLNGGKETTPFILKCVKVLEEHIRVSRKINPQFKRSKWVHEFELLLDSIDGDKDRLKRVLKTFINTPHVKYKPQAESADGFREKFSKIERWCHENANEEMNAPTVTRTTKGNLIETTLHYPKGFRD